MKYQKHLVLVAIAMMIATSIAGLGAASAQATSYRYWTYWLGSDSGWSFSNLGPAFRTPADGSVEGWRFAVTQTVGGAPPRAAASFNDICGDTPAVADRKRVALIVDPGSPSDAPPGENGGAAWASCVVAAPNATGFDILTAKISVRTQRGLICALGTFPATECAPVIRDDPSPTTPAPPPKPQPTRSPSPSSNAPTASVTPNPTSSPTNTQNSPTDPVTSGSQATSTQSTNPGGTPGTETPNPTTAPAVGETAGPSQSAQPNDDTVLLAEGPPEDGLPETSGSAVVITLVILAVAGIGGGAAYAARRRRARDWDV